MKNLKVFLNSVKGRVALVSTLATLGLGLTMTGCETQVVAPDGQTYNVDDQGNITPVTPDTPDTPEVDPEPEVKPDEEIDPIHGAKPEFILLDDAGNYYQPQHVSLEDIEKRINFATEKYNGFKSDWDRDRFVAMLIYYNGPYMNDEDVRTLYWDYLGNFGFNNYDGEEVHARDFNDQYRTKIDYEDYFIDERVAEEAKRYYKWYFAVQDQKKIVDYYKNEIEPKIDYSNPNLYTTAYEDLMNSMMFTIGYDNMPDEYFDNALTIYNFKCKMFDEIIPEKPVREYEIKDYVSSHVDEKEMTR